MSFKQHISDHILSPSRSYARSSSAPWARRNVAWQCRERRRRSVRDLSWSCCCDAEISFCQLVGFVGKNERIIPYFMGKSWKIYGFRCRFSLKSTHWFCGMCFFYYGFWWYVAGIPNVSMVLVILVSFECFLIHILLVGGLFFVEHFPDVGNKIIAIDSYVFFFRGLGSTTNHKYVYFECVIRHILHNASLNGMFH